MHALPPTSNGDGFSDLRRDSAGPYPIYSPVGTPRGSLRATPRTSRRALTSPRGSLNRARSPNPRTSERDTAGLLGQAFFQDLLRRRLNELERAVLADLRRCLGNNMGALTQAPTIVSAPGSMRDLPAPGLPATGSSGALTAPILQTPVSISPIPSPSSSFHATPALLNVSAASGKTSAMCEAEQLERRNNNVGPFLTVPEHKRTEKKPEDGDLSDSDPVLSSGTASFRLVNSDSALHDKEKQRKFSAESVVSGLSYFTLSADEFLHQEKKAPAPPDDVVSARPNIQRARTGEMQAMSRVTSEMTNLKLPPLFLPLPIWRHAMPFDDGDRGQHSTILGSSRCGSMHSQEMMQRDSAKEPYQIEQFGFQNSNAFGLQRLMIHPGSHLNLCKEALKLFCLIFDFFFIPLQVFDLPDSLFTMVLSWLIRGYWTMDIPLTFLTGYFKEQGTAEVSPNAVAKHYARTWLFFDLFCLFFDWLDALVDGIFSLRAIKLGHVARFLRLARLSKSWHASFLIKQNIRSEQVVLLGGIICSIAGMLGMGHFAACIWYMIAKYQSQETITWLKSPEFEDLPRGVQYTISLHWSLAQFTGELIMKPANNTERCFGLVVYFLFFIVATIFVSTITTSMTRLQIISSKQSSQFAQLRRFLLDKGISRQLAMKVLRNAQHAVSEQKHNAPESSVELLEIISTPLRAELHFEVHSRVICSHPFLDAFADENPPAARKFCHTAVSTLTLSIGDNLFNDCETPVRPRMFFIVTGSLEYFRRTQSSPSSPPGCSRSSVLTKSTSCGRSSISGAKAGRISSKRAYEVGPGQSVCEAVLWTNWTHCGTLKALSECGITELDAKLFQEACSTFPSMHPGLYATKFVEHLNELADRDRSLLSDLPPGDYQISRMLECAFPQWEGTEDVDDMATLNYSLAFMRRSSQSRMSHFSGASVGDRRSSRRVSTISARRSCTSSRVSTTASSRGTPSGMKRASLDGIRSSWQVMTGQGKLGQFNWPRNSEAVLPEATDKIAEDESDK